MTDKKPPRKLSSEAILKKWQHDKLTVVQTLAAESAANDAKTTHLRALRLAMSD
jgi:hypothetical protein